MKKYSTILILLLFVGCYNTSSYDDWMCDKPICCSNYIGFMVSGTFGSKKVITYIVKVNNPKDWRYNEYFTGDGFSKDESEAKSVLEADSCELKKIYFNWLIKQNGIFASQCGCGTVTSIK